MSTAEFLAALDPRPNARFVIETYTDMPKGTNKITPDPLSGQWSDLSKDAVLALVPELTRRNEMGAGVFIAVNEFSGSRRKANIKRVRGIHADFDGVDIGQLKKAFKTARPTILVQSSSGKLHGYWLLSDSEVMDSLTTEAINKRLVNDYGADQAASDCSRLLRLPGFRHMKNRGAGNTPTVRLLKVTGRRYTADQLKASFPPVIPAQHQAIPVAPNSLLPVNSTVGSRLSADAAHYEFDRLGVGMTGH